MYISRRILMTFLLEEYIGIVSDKRQNQWQSLTFESVLHLEFNLYRKLRFRYSHTYISCWFFNELCIKTVYQKVLWKMLATFLKDLCTVDINWIIQLPPMDKWICATLGHWNAFIELFCLHLWFTLWQGLNLFPNKLIVFSFFLKFEWLKYHSFYINYEIVALSSEVNDHRPLVGMK